MRASCCARFFSDESQAQALLRDHAAGRERLKALMLMVCVVANAVWQAERRRRISGAQVDQILQAAAGLEIELLPLDWGESLPLARKFNRSAYDAAYLRLADRLNEHLITADERLYNAVRSKLKWVEWVGNYRTE